MLYAQKRNWEYLWTFFLEWQKVDYVLWDTYEPIPDITFEDLPIIENGAIVKLAESKKILEIIKALESKKELSENGKISLEGYKAILNKSETMVEAIKQEIV